MFQRFAEHVFPFLRTLGDGSTYALAKIVDRMDDRDTKGDVYEYMLAKLAHEKVAKDLQRVGKTKKTELLFVALFLRLLKPGGRAAVIVPEGVLFGSRDRRRL